MPASINADEVDERFRELVRAAGLPEPDDAAHLSRAIVFLWYESKAIVLIELDELPPGDPFAGFDAEALAADVLGSPPELYDAAFRATG